MAGLSYVSTGPRQKVDVSVRIPMDESVGAMLFDISGFSNPFKDYPLLYQYFKNGTAQCVNSLDDASMLGIEDNGFLNGLVYYHLKEFYKFVGADQDVYLCFWDCTQGFDIIESIQAQSGGRIFQVGVWTSQPLWSYSNGSMAMTSLCQDLQAQADEVNGKIGARTHRMTPLSIMLFANTNWIGGADIDFRRLPSALEQNCPKVSVFLAQNGSDEVRAIQSRNPHEAPVSAMGIAMACLAVCGCEESIGSVMTCDLNKNEDFRYPEWGFGRTYTPMSEVHRVWANQLSALGYIIPVDYEAFEASYFFSSDQTLSEGDYGTIANNRVMHKCRRAVCTALLPYVNSHHIYNPGTKSISETSKTLISTSIYTLLDSVMRNKSGFGQISGRYVEFGNDDDLLETDTLSMSFTVSPANYSAFITEEVAHDSE